MQLLEKHLSPKRNVLVAQHQFLSKYQKDQQSIAEFVATLRSDIGDCDFISPCECRQSITDIFLRAQFIRGLKDNSIREQLLQSEISTFTEVVSKAIALETSKIDSKEIAQMSTTTGASTNINKVSHQSKKHDRHQKHRPHSQQRHTSNQPTARKQSKSRIDYVNLGIDGLCLRCGRDNHLVKDCRTDKSNLQCTGCSKTGHVVKVCIQTLLGKNSKPNTASINYISGESISNQYGIHSIVDMLQTNQSSKSNIKRYHTFVNIEGEDVKFEVDSGSAYTLLPRDQFAKLNLNIPLLPTTVAFRSYTQNVFVPNGKIKVNINYNGNSIQDEIYIVPEEYVPLLGRIWIRRLQIDLKEIDRQYSSTSDTHSIQHINTIDKIISEYPEVFEEKIGCHKWKSA